jgi:hypothetical protein
MSLRKRSAGASPFQSSVSPAAVVIIGRPCCSITNDADTDPYNAAAKTVSWAARATHGVRTLEHISASKRQRGCDAAQKAVARTGYVHDLRLVPFSPIGVDPASVIALLLSRGSRDHVCAQLCAAHEYTSRVGYSTRGSDAEVEEAVRSVLNHRTCERARVMRYGEHAQRFAGVWAEVSVMSIGGNGVVYTKPTHLSTDTWGSISVRAGNSSGTHLCVVQKISSMTVQPDSRILHRLIHDLWHPSRLFVNLGDDTRRTRRRANQMKGPSSG